MRQGRARPCDRLLPVSTAHRAVLLLSAACAVLLLLVTLGRSPHQVVDDTVWLVQQQQQQQQQQQHGRMLIQAGGLAPTHAIAVPASDDALGNATSSSERFEDALIADYLQRQAPPSDIDALRAAAARPIVVAVVTKLFADLDPTNTANCSLGGVALDCRWQLNGSKALTSVADALVYHTPSWGGRPLPKAFPEQLRIAFNLESTANYPMFDSPRYMCSFDAEASYRTCAQATSWYSLDTVGKLFDEQPVRFEDKLHAIAYINSNCSPPSGRHKILRRLMKLGPRNAGGKVAVHSFGHCDTNMERLPRDEGAKVDVMRNYKFCVAMENAVTRDYITEKLWQALQAGCIPVYLGSSTARGAVPDPNSIIVYDPSGGGDASTPAELDALLHAIGSNKTRYEAMLAWKQRPPTQQPSRLFRHLWDTQAVSGECRLCAFLARHRMDPKPSYTRCAFNEAWAEAVDEDFTSEEEACPALRLKKAMSRHSALQQAAGTSAS